MKLQTFNRLYSRTLVTIFGLAALAAIGSSPAAAMDPNCTRVGSFTTNQITKFGSQRRILDTHHGRSILLSPSGTAATTVRLL
jgi:hypothetical protein